jgi:twitching motility protein PilT
MQLNDLLQLLDERSGSDLHIRVGEPPVMRVHGKLMRDTSFPVLTPGDTEGLAMSILNPERRAHFEENMELDMSYATDFARFRVNVFRQKGNIGIVMRLIPFNIQTIDDLYFTPVLKDLVMRPRGLFLVTGPTGSGKSTTLAAMVDHINTHRRGHIMTIEDPIEFLHKDKLSAINQRELGQDTHSFAAALKHVMRQNPDVILVGEMRDLETIQLAITAAETGHLVFSTVHTTDAPQTIDRIVDVFPPEQQRQIRTQLSVTLLAVLSQTLLPRCDQEGRIAAYEMMIVTPAIRSMIREAKTHQIYASIQTGGDIGMQALDHHLLELVRTKKVRFEDALAKASVPTDFQQKASRVGVGLD